MECRSPGWRPGRRLLDLCRLLGLVGWSVLVEVLWSGVGADASTSGLEFLVGAGGVKQGPLLMSLGVDGLALWKSMVRHGR